LSHNDWQKKKKQQQQPKTKTKQQQQQQQKQQKQLLKNSERIFFLKYTHSNIKYTINLNH
jgi:hypothetical protein